MKRSTLLVSVIIMLFLLPRAWGDDIAFIKEKITPIYLKICDEDRVMTLRFTTKKETIIIKTALPEENIRLGLAAMFRCYYGHLSCDVSIAYSREKISWIKIITEQSQTTFSEEGIETILFNPW